MDEGRIMEMLFSRSQQAVEELRKKYGKLVLRIANNVLNNYEDAQECENDTYLAIWNSIPPKRPESLINYTCGIAKNISLKRYRDEHCQKRSAVFVAIDELADCLPSPSVDEQWSAMQTGKAIDAFLDTIDQESRLAFIYRYWMGDSVKEIAKVLGGTENSISLRLNRTRKKLKEYLKEEGLL